MDKVQYKDKVVLFLDILGFKKHVLSTIDKDGEDIPSQVNLLNGALSRMGEVAFKEGNVKSRMVTQFSDSIVISFDGSEPEMVMDTLNIVLKIWITLALDKILCRGALARGKLIHTEHIVFGPGMIDAYETESKAAMYPRIIMDRSIYNLGRGYMGLKDDIVVPKHVSDYIKLDVDGRYYLDFLNGARHVLTDKSHLKLYFVTMRDIIVQGSKSPNTDIKVKYGYLKIKYNRFLKMFAEPTVDLFESYGSALVEYFHKLKPLKHY